MHPVSLVALLSSGNKLPLESCHRWGEQQECCIAQASHPHHMIISKLLHEQVGCWEAKSNVDATGSVQVCTSSQLPSK